MLSIGFRKVEIWVISYTFMSQYSFFFIVLKNISFEWFWVNENFNFWLLEMILMGLDSGFPGRCHCWLVNQFDPRLLGSNSCSDQILVQIKTNWNVFTKEFPGHTEQFMCAPLYLDVRLSLIKKIWIIQIDNLFLLLPFGKKVLWLDETKLRPLVFISSMFGTHSTLYG